MHGVLRCNISAGVHARANAQSGRVTLRCHNSPRWETEASECEWRHAPEAHGGCWEILKKSVRWDETCLGRRQLAFAGSWRHLWRVPHVCVWGGADEKARIERMFISLPYVETFNSKVIKGFRTWTEKSLRVFRTSRFLCSMFCLYRHLVYVSHIATSWLWYRFINLPMGYILPLLFYIYGFDYE